MIRKTLKRLLLVFIVILLIFTIYFAYLFLSLDRIGDQKLQVSDQVSTKATTNQTYSILTWNIGFGAYTDDYDFFMDGGTKSRAVSEEALKANMEDISTFIADDPSDFYLIEEVDMDSTRSWHVDQRPYLQNALEGYCSTFAQNYDSPYIFYPFHSPIGASESGIMTFSKYQISDSKRVEVPIDKGYTRLYDLDRCYSVNRIPLQQPIRSSDEATTVGDNGSAVADGTDISGDTTAEAELVLYTLHFSAYSKDGSIADEQLGLLLADMQSEYEKGNYCIAGGDFNKDLLGDSSEYFGISTEGYTWSQPIRLELFEDTDLSLVAPDPDKPSARNADSAFHEGQLVLTVDGFIISDNVTTKSCKVLYNGFAYSDHNPVKMTFELK